MPAIALTADRLDALCAELDAFPETIARRGDAYAAEGRVQALQAGEDRIQATVHGTEPYRTQWWWDGRRWAHECTCAYGHGCKHAYAVGAAVCDGEPEEGGAAESEVDAITALRDARALWERQAALDELLVDAPATGLTPYGPPLEELLREPDADTRCWRIAAAIAAEAGHLIYYLWSAYR